MRVFEIALFIILFNAALGFITSIPMFGGTSSPIQYNSTLTIPNATEVVQEINPPNENMSWWEFQWWSWNVAVVRPAQILINVLVSVVAIGVYLKSLIPWIPDGLAVLLSAGVDTLYAIGIIQFFSGRSMKTMR